MYHNPVMLQESVEALNVQETGTYVDVTFGGGGHSAAILARLGKEGKLIAFDQDEDASRNAGNDERFTLVPQNFRYLKRYLKYYGVKEIDGLLADLGVSSYQFDTAERGFSFRFEGPLDMRMNREQTRTAKEIVNTYDADKLLQVLSEYGEVFNAKALVRQIEKERQIKPFTTTEDFVERIEKLIRGERNQYLAKVFQALRIEVNEEMQSLEEMLQQATEVLKPGGRLVVISYHSLEDRLVKNFMRSGNSSGEIEKDFFGHSHTPYKIINKKIITATKEEQQDNPRSRSAKLRVAEKI